MLLNRVLVQLTDETRYADVWLENGTNDGEDRWVQDDAMGGNIGSGTGPVAYGGVLGTTRLYDGDREIVDLRYFTLHYVEGRHGDLGTGNYKGPATVLTPGEIKYRVIRSG